METVILNSIVQAGGMDPGSWDIICRFWQWAFWIGFVVGAVGGIFGLFMKPLED
jgi:hypothetical protein